MRLAWLWATAQQLAPYLGGLIVAMFLAEWLLDWDGALTWSLTATTLFALGLASIALGLRITDWDASRAAERGLGARDALTTALEFTDPSDEVHGAIQERAERIALSASPSTAIPVRARPDRLRQVGLAAAIALLIALLPPIGDTPALSIDLQTALEAEAQEVERIADAIAAEDVENADEIIAELRRLAEELRAAATLEEALDALEDTETRLDAMLDPNQLAQKAAVQGLANDLALRPLVDGTLDAAEQFEQLSQILDQLSEPELRALQDRLEDLAESQAAGNPSLSTQLSQAAASLSSGDLAGASQALSEAADAQRSGVSQARGQQAISETQRGLDSISSRLSGEGSPDGTGVGDGEGAEGGEGSQEGSQGSGSGQQGSGDGASPSGAISDVAPGGGGASGQGGEGTVGAGSGEDHGTEVSTSSVYDPAVTGPASDLLQVDISGGDAQGDITQLKDAPTFEGESVVPYATVLPRYLNVAADALAALRLPPAMRGIVQSYFDRLAEAAR